MKEFGCCHITLSLGTILTLHIQHEHIDIIANTINLPFGLFRTDFD
jgi:hypothetical protein